MKKITVFLLLIITIYRSSAQSVNAPLNIDYYHWIDRAEIKRGVFMNELHTSFKPYKRKTIATLVDTSVNSSNNWSKTDAFNWEYLANDNQEWSVTANTRSEKPVLKHFYTQKTDVYSVQKPDFDLHLNPVMYVSLGRNSGESKIAATYINTRGIEIRGLLANKVGFYTYLGENQTLAPLYTQRFTKRFRSVPREGFYKAFGSTNSGFDYFTARGYLSFDLIPKYLNVQFGHDKFFVGNGYRSLILSDHSNNYLFLKFQTRVWKIHYTNLFAEINATAFGGPSGSLDQPFPKKYFAFHHLSINITNNFNLGIFESVIINADEDEEGFELNYLNPIIFYRAIEHQNGSQDNALLGLDFKWNLFKSISLYGQVVLDEFLLDNIIAQNGWWGNKYGFQLGGKYIDALGINALDIQIEGNIVRPYTYTHRINSNYTHYNMALAHPMGANFLELIASARYQPLPRLNLSTRIIIAKYGEDQESMNYGKDILLSYDTRVKHPNNKGHKLGQGIPVNFAFLDFTASYMLIHNLFIDARAVLRKESSPEAQFNHHDTYLSFGVRWNVPRRINDF